MANRRAFPIGVCACVTLVSCGVPGPPIDVAVTAYCRDGVTRSGTPTREGIVAADPRVLPLGSVVRIEGLGSPHNGTYTVTDTGGAIKGHRIDIFMPDCAEARRFGRQDAQLRVIERGDEGGDGSGDS